jgi:hypothetical protein
MRPLLETMLLPAAIMAWLVCGAHAAADLTNIIVRLL